MSSHTQSADNPYLIQHIPPSRPFVWLGQAWGDLRHFSLASLAYGLIVTAMGAVVLMFNNHPYMLAGSLTAFLLVGPVMTTGLCELSRCRESGIAADFGRSLKALRHNRAGLVGFANRLVVIAVAWMLLSAAYMHTALGSAGPALEETVWGGAWGALSGEQLLIYLAIWAVLSLIVFSISVVSVPMLLHQGTDAATAMKTSIRATARDFPAMMVWAVLILLLVGLGFATGLAGMVVIFPLLGHATWHAYREVVHQGTSLP